MSVFVHLCVCWLFYGVWISACSTFLCSCWQTAPVSHDVIPNNKDDPVHIVVTVLVFFDSNTVSILKYFEAEY